MAALAVILDGTRWVAWRFASIQNSTDTFRVTFCVKDLDWVYFLIDAGPLGISVLSESEAFEVSAHGYVVD